METFKQVISMGRDKLISGIRYVYSDINPSTLTGAIDVIVVEQMDGSFNCGPFHVRFGKMGTLKPANKIVDIHLNGVYLEHLHMKLGSAGEAYFIETVEESSNESFDSSLVVSPFHSDNEDVDEFEKPDLANSRISSKSRSRRKIGTPDLYMKRMLEMSLSQDEIGYDAHYQCLSDNDDFAVDDNQEELVRTGYHSDGAVDTISNEELVDINMTWDWGNFPSNGSEKSAESNKEDAETQKDAPELQKDELEIKKEASEVKKEVSEMKKEAPKASTPKTEALPNILTKRPSKEIYLEDIMSADISDELKRAYLYTESPKIHSPTNPLSDIFPTTTDAGYRSDGEASISPASPACPAIHELKLSLCGDINSRQNISPDSFYQHLISFEDFLKDADELLKNPNLVLLLNGEYYNWTVAAPIILSIVAFQSSLPQITIAALKTAHMSQKKRRSTWFSWRRQDEPPPNPPITPATTPTATVAKDAAIDITAPQSSHSSKVYKKKIRLSSHEVAALDLREGRNDIKFSMTTMYQGTSCCYATVYRWKWYDKIVISDVDGTITKSDVLGHFLPILGRDWTQAGVAKLYNKIAQNNYRFIYLSARAIGQAGSTRTFLNDIVQEATDKLPEGPILLSPTSLFQSLHREVIEKKPEYFKIQCLNDVRSLFAREAHPLYAGFGNRVNDVIAYKAVGVDPKRIFTVNPEGSLKNEYCQKWSTSYGNLFDVADHFFQFQQPPYGAVGGGGGGGSARRRPRNSFGGEAVDHALEDYIDVNYWARPIDEQQIRDEINKSKRVK